MNIDSEQRIDLVIWPHCEIVKEEIDPENFVVSYDGGEHEAHSVRIGMGAKYHASLLPWLTKCGRVVDDNNATYSHNHVNCKACRGVTDPVFTYKAGGIWVVVWRRYAYGPGESLREYSMRIYPAENYATHILGWKHLASDLQALGTSITTLRSQDCIENDIRRADAELLLLSIHEEGQKSDYFPLRSIAHVLGEP